MTRVNSYDKNAKLPKNGSIWVWELDSPYARAIIEVVETIWNGEEWWVRTKDLLPMPFHPNETTLNDLSRFWQACTLVRK